VRYSTTAVHAVAWTLCAVNAAFGVFDFWHHSWFGLLNLVAIAYVAYTTGYLIRVMKG
jgi:hypothetical protein